MGSDAALVLSPYLSTNERKVLLSLFKRMFTSDIT